MNRYQFRKDGQIYEITKHNNTHLILENKDSKPVCVLREDLNKLFRVV